MPCMSSQPHRVWCAVLCKGAAVVAEAILLSRTHTVHEDHSHSTAAADHIHLPSEGASLPLFLGLAKCPPELPLPSIFPDPQVDVGFLDLLQHSDEALVSPLLVFSFFRFHWHDGCPPANAGANMVAGLKSNCSRSTIFVISASSVSLGASLSNPPMRMAFLRPGPRQDCWQLSTGEFLGPKSFQTISGSIANCVCGAQVGIDRIENPLRGLKWAMLADPTATRLCRGLAYLK